MKASILDALEALKASATRRAAARNGGSTGRVTTEILQEVVDDFIPPTYPLEV